MYIPSLYKMDNILILKEWIKRHSFGIIISHGAPLISATHIPLELTIDADGEECFYGHVSLANPQWKEWKEGEDVLLIFTGPHAYISASWYDHENVSTWNYQAVHVYGHLHFINDQERNAAIMHLMDKYEANQKNPIHTASLSEDTMSQIRGIKAFKVKPIEYYGVNKMSQNRHNDDFKHIVRRLGESADYNDQQVGMCMRNQRPDLDYE